MVAENGTCIGEGLEYCLQSIRIAIERRRPQILSARQRSLRGLGEIVSKDEGVQRWDSLLFV